MYVILYVIDLYVNIKLGVFVDMFSVCLLKSVVVSYVIYFFFFFYRIWFYCCYYYYKFRFYWFEYGNSLFIRLVVVSKLVYYYGLF